MRNQKPKTKREVVKTILAERRKQLRTAQVQEVANKDLWKDWTGQVIRRHRRRTYL